MSHCSTATSVHFLMTEDILSRGRIRLGGDSFFFFLLYSPVVVFGGSEKRAEAIINGYGNVSLALNSFSRVYMFLSPGAIQIYTYTYIPACLRRRIKVLLSLMHIYTPNAGRKIFPHPRHSAFFGLHHCLRCILRSLWPLKKMSHRCNRDRIFYNPRPCSRGVSSYIELRVFIEYMTHLSTRMAYNTIENPNPRYALNAMN